MVMPRIPLGHAENFRKCIDAKLGFCACFPYTSMAILNILWRTFADKNN